MSSKDAALYNQPKHNLKGSKEISTSTSLSFTSQLSSLISAPKAQTTKPTSQRLRPKKDDIFSKANRNTSKRAKRDLEGSSSFEQRHTTNGETLDRSIWERSKRKMEEKARLYAAMKRGDVEDVDERYTVDFDRKWAEGHDKGKEEEEDLSDNDEDDHDADPEDSEIIEYTDEFGRSRTGTRAEANRIKRIQSSKAELESDRFTTRPAAPTNVIYGDTIQHGAFNPDAPIADHMEELAAKRDRSLTPPPEQHFDSRAEIRNHGTGFFQFSADKEERKRQMEGLEREREETERVRRERGKRKADEFLEELGLEMGGGKRREDEMKGGGTEETERIKRAVERQEEGDGG